MVDGVETSYVYDQDRADNLEPGNIVLEFSGSSTTDLTTRWLHSPKADEALEFERYTTSSLPGSGSTYALFSDRQGSVSQVVILTTGTLAANYSYDAYGVREATTAEVAQPYGYTGREVDVESGLLYLRWRNYDPQTGMFLQMDPMGFAGGQENLYAYVDNDPFNATDPMGLSAYFDYKVTIDGRKQMLGGVTRSVSSGVFSVVANMIEAMNGDWRSFSGNAQTVSPIAPASGKSCHGNSGQNEGGQHLYVIYSRENGRTLKVGIGSNDDLYAGGSRSRRADRQMPRFGGHTKAGQTVLITVPGGFMARAQAMILEKMMVTMLEQLGMPVNEDFHKRPVAEPDNPKWCPI